MGILTSTFNGYVATLAAPVLHTLATNGFDTGTVITFLAAGTGTVWHRAATGQFGTYALFTYLTVGTGTVFISSRAMGNEATGICGRRIIQAVKTAIRATRHTANGAGIFAGAACKIGTAKVGNAVAADTFLIQRRGRVISAFAVLPDTTKAAGSVLTGLFALNIGTKTGAVKCCCATRSSLTFTFHTTLIGPANTVRSTSAAR